MASKPREFARAAARRLMTRPAIAKSLRPFCVTCPIAEKSYALRSQLTWTHWRLLMRADDAAARDYYSHDCVAFYAPASAECPNVQRPVAHLDRPPLVALIAEVDAQIELDRYAVQAFSGDPIAKQAVSQCRRNHAVRLLQI